MKNKIITLGEKRPEQALEHLRRITGLDFHSMPTSLIKPSRITNLGESSAVSLPQQKVS